MKLSFLKSIEQFAITHLGAIQDSDNDMTALMQRNGMLSDSDDGDSDDDFDFDLDDFDSDDFDPDAVPNSCGVEADYISRQISRISSHGDDARWRLASHLDMFENLDPRGALTNEQREAVDNFAIGWQSDRTESE